MGDYRSLLRSWTDGWRDLGSKWAFVGIHAFHISPKKSPDRSQNNVGDIFAKKDKDEHKIEVDRLLPNRGISLYIASKVVDSS
jgi:hypothetical protein